MTISKADFAPKATIAQVARSSRVHRERLVLSKDSLLASIAHLGTIVLRVQMHQLNVQLTTTVHEPVLNPPHVQMVLTHQPATEVFKISTNVLHVLLDIIAQVDVLTQQRCAMLVTIVSLVQQNQITRTCLRTCVQVDSIVSSVLYCPHLVLLV